MHSDITSCEKFTAQQIRAIRSNLAEALKDRRYSIVTVGSYARGEASAQSDLDYFLICDSDDVIEQARTDIKLINEIVKKYIAKDYASDGAFGQPETIDQMVQNIGGSEDTNKKITRRILFLLEGEWLLDESRFVKYRDQLISKYIKDSISDHQFCRFLLNDLIRYYRTICVDFEHKTVEKGKAWGTRNIKLIFSRKLLYFSGIVVAAETWQQTYDDKVEKIKLLLSLTPIRRIHAVCGSQADQSLNAYGEFLKKMADQGIRKIIESAPEVRDDQPSEFRRFKNEGHHFSLLLVKLLKDTYDAAHPIHNALVV